LQEDNHRHPTLYATVAPRRPGTGPGRGAARSHLGRIRRRGRQCTNTGAGAAASSGAAGQLRRSGHLLGCGHGVAVGRSGTRPTIQTRISLDGRPLDYTATTGHLTATDLRTGQPAASFFYVAYIAGAQPTAQRPVTFSMKALTSLR
jgi:hypothetical protein